MIQKNCLELCMLHCSLRTRYSVADNFLVWSVMFNHFKINKMYYRQLLHEVIVVFFLLFFSYCDYWKSICYLFWSLTEAWLTSPYNLSFLTFYYFLFLGMYSLRYFKEGLYPEPLELALALPHKGLWLSLALTCPVWLVFYRLFFCSKVI